MNRPDTIYHATALIILTIVFILFWNFTTGTFDVESRITVDRVVIDTLSIMYGHLYRMIPICCAFILFSLAIAFYLEEWLPHESWQYQIIERQIAILASIPSLVYGLLGTYFFVVKSNKISYLTLTITAVLLIVPVTIQSTQKAVQGVEIHVREAAYALGANRWRVIADHVFPRAFRTISGGIFTAISRVFAIAALIIVVCEWRITVSQAAGSFGIPKSVVVLLSIAMFTSVLSSLFEKKTGIREN